MSPLLSGYHQNFPEVQIELLSGTSAALLGKVHRFEVEAAFVAEPFAHSELESQAAFTEELVLIAPKDTPTVRTPEDLQKRSVIAFSSGCSYRRVLEDWLSASAVVPDHVLELGSYHAIVACVAAGSGIAIMPRSVLGVVRAENEVAIFALPKRVARVNTYLVWRKGHQSVALTALQRELQLMDR